LTIFSLECTTDCAKTERNRRIALALQIRNPDLSPNVTPRYSDFMKEFAKKDVAFCNYIHEKLAELVTNAKQVCIKMRLIKKKIVLFCNIYSLNKIHEVIHLK